MNKCTWRCPSRSFSRKKIKKMYMEIYPTFIFTKENRKNVHGDVPHGHFYERKMKKCTWRSPSRSFSRKKIKKMYMEICSTVIFTKENRKNVHGGLPHGHFHERKMNKCTWRSTPRSFLITLTFFLCLRFCLYES